jgi:hypothetical protein
MEELLARGGESDVLEYLCTLFPDFRWNRTGLHGEPAAPAERAIARSAGAA